jgi:hypothetical protein
MSRGILRGALQFTHQHYLLFSLSLIESLRNSFDVTDSNSQRNAVLPMERAQKQPPAPRRCNQCGLVKRDHPDWHVRQTSASGTFVKGAKMSCTTPKEEYLDGWDGLDDNQRRAKKRRLRNTAAAVRAAAARAAAGGGAAAANEGREMG